MSKIANDIYSKLKELFPNNVIIKEHYINYKGTRLFFDFYIKDLGILIECQGRQHFEYVDHFHGSISAFRAQKRRDNLKKEFIQENDTLCLVYFYDKQDEITDDLIFTRILKAQNLKDGV